MPNAEFLLRLAAPEGQQVFGLTLGPVLEVRPEDLVEQDLETRGERDGEWLPRNDQAQSCHQGMP